MSTPLGASLVSPSHVYRRDIFLVERESNKSPKDDVEH